MCTHNCCFGMLHVFACPGWITSVKSAVCTFLHQTIVPYFFFLFILSLILLENVWLQYLNSMLSFQINKPNKQWIYNKLFINWQTDRQTDRQTDCWSILTQQHHTVAADLLAAHPWYISLIPPPPTGAIGLTSGDYRLFGCSEIIACFMFLKTERERCKHCFSSLLICLFRWVWNVNKTSVMTVQALMSRSLFLLIILQRKGGMSTR